MPIKYHAYASLSLVFLLRETRLAHVYATAVVCTILGIDTIVVYFTVAGYINLAAVRTFPFP